MFHWVCWKNNTLFRSLVFTGCMILSWVCHCSPLIVWLSGIEGAKRLFESNLSGFQSIVMLQVWYFHFSGGVGCAPWASVDSRCDGCGGCQHGLSSLGRRQLHPGWGSCWFDSCWGCGGVLVQNDSGCRMELLSPSTRASRRRWRVERWLLVWSWDGMVTKWNLTKEMLSFVYIQSICEQYNKRENWSKRSDSDHTWWTSVVCVTVSMTHVVHQGRVCCWRRDWGRLEKILYFLPYEFNKKWGEFPEF